jgi:hypothetical protein
MLVYSEKIVRFIEEIKSCLKLILIKEVGLSVHGDRFYDKKKKTSYPIKIVIYNDQKNLGYFDPSFYELGFHESVLHASKETLLNLIRHELGHYLTFIFHGDQIQPHGSEYRNVCKNLGWGKEVYEASTSLEIDSNHSNLIENPIFRKIQKLMALGSSSSKHEAELAILKSRELLLKHHIDMPSIEVESEKMFLARIMKQAKRNAKMIAISRILETFFVSTVFHKGVNCTYLEILGTKLHIEIAEYASKFLDYELDKLWEEIQKKANLKGITAKNSFFLGIAKGYCDKIGALKTEHSNALVLIENKLTAIKEMAYGRLSKMRSGHKYCPKSGSLGKEAGSSLSIRKAVKNSSSPPMLTYN